MTGSRPCHASSSGQGGFVGCEREVRLEDFQRSEARLPDGWQKLAQRTRNPRRCPAGRLERNGVQEDVVHRPEINTWYAFVVEIVRRSTVENHRPEFGLEPLRFEGGTWEVNGPTWTPQRVAW